MILLGRGKESRCLSNEDSCMANVKYEQLDFGKKNENLFAHIITNNVGPIIGLVQRAEENFIRSHLLVSKWS